MKIIKFKISKPSERVLTRDYWELLEIDPIDRFEYTNEFYYKNVKVSDDNKVNSMRKLLKLKRAGWKLYETVDLEVTDDTVIYKFIKVISFCREVKLFHGSTVDDDPLYESVNNKPLSAHDLPIFIDIHDSKGIQISIDQRLKAEDIEDQKLFDNIVKILEKRVCDKIDGKKVYDDHELFGRGRCSVGAASFIKRHCNYPIYRDDLCYYHWIQAQDKRSGCNPALPGESLHTTKQPYIKMVNVEDIEAKMKQYYDASKPITPAGEEKKYARCKHLLIAGECSICNGSGSTSIDLDDMTGLPIGIDIAIKRNLEKTGGS